MAYRTWDKMDPQVQKALLNRADDCLTNLEQL
jgi:deoxyribodipyrimidine photolyase-related protein